VVVVLFAAGKIHYFTFSGILLKRNHATRYLTYT
jgi:hypothetical protein